MTTVQNLTLHNLQVSYVWLTWNLRYYRYNLMLLN